ncbi:MAG: LysM peptidoglycan-binding domain-containing protein [Pseudomonadota bacterium]
MMHSLLSRFLGPLGSLGSPGSLGDADQPPRRPAASFALRLACAGLGAGLLAAGVQAQVPNYPITGEQRATARQVADAGVPLSELSPNAPDSYTVKRGDTLWAISGLFLKRPWRWPELWGMNLDQIRNPHLIYPGQVLYLDKSNGRARLRVGQPLGPQGDVKLSPRVREAAFSDAIGAVPLNLIEPFLNEAVIFDNEQQLAAAPRIVATQEGRVMLGRGETAYVLGELGGRRDWRIFRQPRPLLDPTTREVLGYEAVYVGTADYEKSGHADGRSGQAGEVVPDTFTVTSIRLEAGVGDRLAPVPQREFVNYVPHAPERPIAGQIVSIYGEALSAGQNQIVALNRGARDGLERGHVLILLSDGRLVRDTTQDGSPQIKLPNEKQGLLFVFRTFDKMSYALIMSANDPIKVGDRFSQP